MIWTKYIIRTTTRDADMISAILMDYDINDIEIENNVQLTDDELNQMYADFAKELPEDDGSCTINFYMEFSENDADRAAEVEKLNALKQELKDAEELFGIEPVELESLEVDTADWENNWKEYFKPFNVDDILIAPTWEEIPEDAESSVVIRIDPGMAFGTGMHETTRLCLRGIRKYMKDGDRLLDLGCGSGILSIGAMKLGAKEVTAVDIDPQAVDIARENFEVNEIPMDKVTLLTGDVVNDEALKADLSKEGFEIVAANILAEVIAMMMLTLDVYLKDGAVLITSGILATKEQMIRDAVAANGHLEVIEVVPDGDWISVVCRK
ncbi:MAG: 50S ribosomal protein L11 methyltransferase, partial [Lachnospiraceae bacterium]|nr:50S ribosomal protein L11 methyltransferase [Lachnospiraceae bacterium]